jgi:hypothetical protein
MPYLVIHESGFSYNSKIVRGPFKTKKEAKASKNRILKDGDGGAADYPLPKWAKYEDEVGYDYHEVVEYNVVENPDEPGEEKEEEENKYIIMYNINGRELAVGPFWSREEAEDFLNNDPNRSIIKIKTKSVSNF